MNIDEVIIFLEKMIGCQSVSMLLSRVLMTNTAT